MLRLAHHLQPLDRKELLQPFAKFCKRERFGQPAPSARALAFGVRQDGCDAAQAKPAAKRWFTPLKGRIERRVRTIDGDACGDQVQQQSADRRVRRQPLDRRKWHGMMGDDQIDARFDGLGRAGRRDRQAGHQLLDALRAMADQQPDIVPFLGQSEGGNLFKKRSDGGDVGHGCQKKDLKIVCVCLLTNVQHLLRLSLIAAGNIFGSARMDIPSSEVVKVIYALLPGFVAAWIFYALTAYPRLSPFERTVQALIFTGIIQVISLVLRELMFLFGAKCCLGVWTDNVSFVTSIIIAILFGLSFSASANNNWIHPWLQRWRITKQPSYPSEWFTAFNEYEQYVVLHLTGSRRILGWPCEWPNCCDSGHFVLMNASWLSDENVATPLENVQVILIPAKDVEMVEFLETTSGFADKKQEQSTQ